MGISLILEIIMVMHNKKNRYKKILICLIFAIVIGFVITNIVLWFIGKRISDIIITSDIVRVDIMLFGNPEESVVYTEKKDINQFISDIDTFSLKKRMGESKDGFMFEVLITHQDESIDKLIISGEIAINQSIYTCSGDVMKVVEKWYDSAASETDHKSIIN